MSKVWGYVWLLVSGLAVGWLCGLSSSPVASTLITAVIGAAIAAVTALSGVSERQGTVVATIGKINPLPIALFALGLAVAAPVGILARTSSWFAPPYDPPTLSDTVDEWTSLGLEKEVVVDALFERWKTAEPVTPSDTTVDDPALLSQEATKFCNSVSTELEDIGSGDLTRLANIVVGSNIAGLSQIAGEIEGDSLKKAVVAYCAAFDVTLT